MFRKIKELFKKINPQPDKDIKATQKIEILEDGNKYAILGKIIGNLLYTNKEFLNNEGLRYEIRIEAYKNGIHIILIE